MAIVILKTQSGIKYPLDNGEAVTLKGYGLMNKVDNALWNRVKLKYKSTIDQLIGDGFLVESASETSETKNGVADTMQKTLDKQNKDIAKNKVKTKIGDKTIETGITKD